jgi:hypothetical protein
LLVRGAGVDVAHLALAPEGTLEEYIFCKTAVKMLLVCLLMQTAPVVYMLEMVTAF